MVSNCRISICARAAMFRDAGSRPTGEASTIRPRRQRIARRGWAVQMAEAYGPAGEIVSGEGSTSAPIHVLARCAATSWLLAARSSSGQRPFQRDVTVISGSLQRDPTARVSGEVV